MYLNWTMIILHTGKKMEWLLCEKWIIEYRSTYSLFNLEIPMTSKRMLLHFHVFDFQTYFTTMPIGMLIIVRSAKDDWTWHRKLHLHFKKAYIFMFMPFYARLSRDYYILLIMKSGLKFHSIEVLILVHFIISLWELYLISLW